MEKILLFGTGIFYANRKVALADVLGDDKIVGFLDNHSSAGQVIDGRPVYLPKEIREVSYDRILLMSNSVHEMREQLLEMDVPAEKISLFGEYRAQKVRGTFQLPVVVKDGRPSVLMLSDEMKYDGASVVLTFAARALQRRGYQVTISAPYMHPDMEAELQSDGITFVCCPTIPYLSATEETWIAQYDILLVNVFSNIRVACTMRRMMPTFWWIHDAGEPYANNYPSMRYQFHAYDSEREMDGIHVMAVSRLAASVFLRHYPSVSIGVMPYGIPDTWDKWNMVGGRPVFAIIGYCDANKGQREFLDAVRILKEGHPDVAAEFWIIGAQSSSAYGREVVERAQALSCVKCKGVLTRSEMEEAYRYIDVVVCASHEEMLSTVCVEGLMHAKVCLTVRNNGLVSYLADGVNAFVCEDNQPGHLASAMERVLAAKQQWQSIGACGRKVYERHFSIEKFGERLERELDHCKMNYKKLKNKKRGGNQKLINFELSTMEGCKCSA